MPNPVIKTLVKQKSDLEAKGAMRTKHEDVQLANLKAKIALAEKAIKS